jgi:glucosylceramidase
LFKIAGPTDAHTRNPEHDKEDSLPQSRRDFLKLSAATLAVMKAGYTFGAVENRKGEIAVRLTAGATARFASQPGLKWQPVGKTSGPAILLDPSKTYQEVLGVGAALTEAACYMFNQLTADVREQIFRELYHPSEMGFGVCRTCIGSSDYATVAYSYDDGDPDPELRRFSIDYDRAYVLPMLRLARKMNPELFLFAAPWSPPGWMKANGSMLGGSMHKRSLPVYANYFVKYLKAYAAEGVVIDAVTPQNEVDTDQDGKMPASFWAQEIEIEFVGKHLGPVLEKNQLATKIWIMDHNWNLWGRAMGELEDADVYKYADGIAWHVYVGKDTAMTRVHDAYPNKHAYVTECSPDFQDPAYMTSWATWAEQFASMFRNWARCVTSWNLALDEKGRPNIGPFTAGGVLSINSGTHEIVRTGQYWALAHFAYAVRRGGRRFDSVGELEKVSHVGFAYPDGRRTLVLTNTGKETKARLQLADMSAEVVLPESSVLTLNWR